MPAGAKEVRVCFPRGSDSITQYDVYLFSITPDCKFFFIKLFMLCLFASSEEEEKNKHFTPTRFISLAKNICIFYIININLLFILTYY